MLTLVLAESALEPVPRSLWMHPSVQRYAQLRGKSPGVVILDRSYHHAAMRKLKEGEKRGRPDIVQFALLEALGSPLNKEGLLQVFVHTINDFVITVDRATRLPRNCNRFTSLMEQLFDQGRIPPRQPEKPLLTVKRQTLPELFRIIKPSYTLAFSRLGRLCTLEDAVAKAWVHEKPAMIVGAFPHGHFSKTTSKLAKDVFSIDPEMLETWTIVSRIVYESERAISLPGKRLNR